MHNEDYAKFQMVLASDLSGHKVNAQTNAILATDELLFGFYDKLGNH